MGVFTLSMLNIAAVLSIVNFPEQAEYGYAIIFYITAASTPRDVEVGYVFVGCKLRAAPGVDKVYLGRPWRPYAATVFIRCEMGKHICPAGWDNWRNPDNEKTARYGEYGNTGAGAAMRDRVKWIETLSPAKAGQLSNPDYIYKMCKGWKLKNERQDKVGE